jgi:hypothetical protein
MASREKIIPPKPIKEIYYYGRDTSHTPWVTVCLMKWENGLVSRGIALCCPTDEINPKLGRRKARARALRGGLGQKVYDLPINYWILYFAVQTALESIGLLPVQQKPIDFMLYKIQRFLPDDVGLTDFEKRLLTKPTKL